MVLLLLIRCWLLLPLWDSVIVLCFVVRDFCVHSSFAIILMGKREGWFLCFVCLSGDSWLLCGSSSRRHGFVCSLWLWYFLIILIYYTLCTHWLQPARDYCAFRIQWSSSLRWNGKENDRIYYVYLLFGWHQIIKCIKKHDKENTKTKLR